MYHDTIAAIATPPGQGALGIVRLSGPESWDVTGRLFGATLEDHRAVHGYVRDPATGVTVDEALVTAMRSPKTYTGEDTAEISCHGSPLVLQRVLELALKHGARLANPGEFTLRAFLNGRIDLAQAEAVLDVIQAQTDAGLRLAVEGLRGRLSEPIKDARAKLMQVLAYYTALVDFPEDEVEAQMEGDPAALLCVASQTLRSIVDQAAAGMVYRHGIRTAIVGRPNVGKSSLLNRLLGEERAIVTPVPGTTRDTIEETVAIAGIPFHLVDTAGIRDTADTVEHLGIERSRKAVAQADLLLLIVDASAPMTPADRELLALAYGKARIVVANKSDLPARVADADLPSPAVRISALTGDGLVALHDAMAQAALGGKVTPSDTALVTNPRQKAALERALAHAEQARDALATSTPADFVTIDLQAAVTALGEITGEDASEELLDTIFREFCIGK